MEFDLEGKHADRAYPLLVSVVVPRPIALVTTLGPDGVVNAAPFSFFNVLGANPPILGFAPGNRASGVPKDTARNVRLQREFVVNLVDESIGEAMNCCAASLEYGVSELTSAGLTTVESSSIRTPRIAEAPVSMECLEWGTLEIGENRLVIGLIKRLHVKDQYVDPEKLRIRNSELHLIGRMASPHWYCRTRDQYEMIRPD